MQEFQRLCALKGLEVTVIPLSDHHPNFCADDIEMWEVTRMKENSLSSSASNQRNVVVLQWDDNSDHVPIVINGKQFNINQSSSQGIGGALWPSSIIVSR